MEDDYVIDTIQKLRLEVFVQNLSDRLAHLLFVIADFQNLARTEIGSHDQNGILKIDRAAFRIRQATIVQDLQEHVENIRMRFLDFVEEDHTVRPATNCFR